VALSCIISIVGIDDNVLEKFGKRLLKLSHIIGLCWFWTIENGTGFDGAIETCHEMGVSWGFVLLKT
jgi:hypothetical protein